MMDQNFNVTYIKLNGHVQVKKLKYLYFLIMFIVYVMILCSNFIIVFLTVVEKSLHEPMYIFIAAQSVNSLLFSTVIYPKLLVDFLSQRQIISYSACCFQHFLFYSLGCSEFLLLAAMAYDRYVSICKPLQYTQIMGKTTVSILLFLAWFLPACQIAVAPLVNLKHIPCTLILRGIFCNNSIKFLYCGTSRALSIYGFVLLFNVVFFPVLFIFVTYARIFVIASKSCGKVRKKAAQTCLPHLLVLICFTCFGAYDVIVPGLDLNVPKVVRFVMTLHIVTCQPLFNPIIYGLKMKEISKQIKKLFCRVHMTNRK